MGSPHENDSQQRLHELFGTFFKLTEQHISDALTRTAEESRARGRNRVRVLDLGPGAVPYAAAFASFATNSSSSGLSLELVFVDNDTRLLPGQTIPGWTSDWIDEDVFEIAGKNDARLLQACSGTPEPFDLVLISASLHEFYFDVVSKPGSWPPETFHMDFLEWVRRLVRDHASRIIISDYGWSDGADPAHVIRITHAQKLIIHHADPPWAFVGIGKLLESSKRCGFHPERFHGRGLYDDLSDEDIQRFFCHDQLGESRLSQAECSTMRERYGYVLTFTVVAHQDGPDPQDNWDQDLIRMGHAVEKLFKLDNRTREETSKQLDAIFTGDEGGTSGSLLGRFGRRVRKDTISALAPLRVPDVGDLEVWIGIGLKTLEHGRYVPDMALPWRGRRPGPSGVRVGPEGNGGAGPVAIPFWHLLKTPEADESDIVGRPPMPTIHNWLVWANNELHRTGMGETTAAAWQGPSRIRSLTILSPLCGPEDRALMAEWGDVKSQHQTGHFVVQFPVFSGQEQEYPWETLGRCLRDKLESFSNLLLPPAAAARFSWLPHLFSQPAANIDSDTPDAVEYTYSAFLATVFGLADRGNVRQAVGRVASFIVDPVLEGCVARLLLELDEYYRYLKDEQRKPPRYSAYTTIALNCDGSTEDPPDSVMFFAGHPIPPKLIDHISTYAADLCRPSVVAESNSVKERQGRTQGELDTLLSLIPSFAHDSKKPATVIEKVLGSTLPLDLKHKAAGILAGELAERLDSHATLLRKPESNSLARKQALTLPFDSDDLTIDWTTAAAIWNEALCAVLLGACIPIDERGTDLATYLRGASPTDVVGAYVNATERRFEDMKGALQHFSSVSDSLSQLSLPVRITLNRGKDVVRPAACKALRFILTEIATNIFRHSFWRTSPKCFGELSLDVDATIREADSDAYSTADRPMLANIRVTAFPSPEPRQRVRSNCDGLRSLRLVAGMVGASISEENLTVEPQDSAIGQEQKKSLPYPRWDPSIQKLVWQIMDFPVFLRSQGARS